jgi:hypothetical protein
VTAHQTRICVGVSTCQYMAYLVCQYTSEDASAGYWRSIKIRLEAIIKHRHSRPVSCIR